MRSLDLRPEEDCRYDVATLGEVMLRLDPGEGRIRTARTLQVWEGGGEYNVGRALRRCFGLRALTLTALVDDEVGRLLEDLLLQGGTDVHLVSWVEGDGLGWRVRNGLNFTERGHGLRGPRGTSDRGHSAAAAMRPQDVDWDHVFGDLGVRILHTGGIFAGLSDTTPGVAEAAMTAARKHGTVVAYDLNYRASLWAERGGAERARAVNRRLVEQVDILFGNLGHFDVCLGFDAPEDADPFDAEAFATTAERIAGAFDVALVATTMRSVHTATAHDWGGAGWAGGQLAIAPRRHRLPILDRVGGGDGFASGVLFGVLSGADLETSVALGTAHGALVMSTPGDTSMATRAEVEALATGAGVDVRR